MATITIHESNKRGKTYIARLTGRDKKFGFARTFERGTERAMQCIVEYDLPDGIYEVQDLIAGQSLQRKYIVVEGGKIATITKDEAAGKFPQPEAAESGVVAVQTPREIRQSLPAHRDSIKDLPYMPGRRYAACPKCGAPDCEGVTGGPCEDF